MWILSEFDMSLTQAPSTLKDARRDDFGGGGSVPGQPEVAPVIGATNFFEADVGRKTVKWQQGIPAKHFSL